VSTAPEHTELVSVAGVVGNALPGEFLAIDEHPFDALV
jgi:hypothetical protein